MFSEKTHFQKKIISTAKFLVYNKLGKEQTHTYFSANFERVPGVVWFAVTDGEVINTCASSIDSTNIA